MTKRAALIGVTAALLLSTGARGLGQDGGGYKIIVNTQNPVSGLSKAEISSFFLRKDTTWADGQPVLPVDHAASSPVRESFSRDVLGMSPAAAARAAAAGGEPPLSVATDRDVLAYVRLKPGAIGYVSANAQVAGVKVVAIGRAGELAPASASSGSQEPLRAGGAIGTPRRVFDVHPKYPELARTSRTQGTVELEIVIAPDGSVASASVVKSIPLLDEAAVNAVRQWRYEPTRVNGNAVAVTTIVRVTFVL